MGTLQKVTYEDKPGWYDPDTEEFYPESDYGKFEYEGQMGLVKNDSDEFAPFDFEQPKQDSSMWDEAKKKAGYLWEGVKQAPSEFMQGAAEAGTVLAAAPTNIPGMQAKMGDEKPWLVKMAQESADWWRNRNEKNYTQVLPEDASGWDKALYGASGSIARQAPALAMGAAAGPIAGALMMASDKYASRLNEFRREGREGTAYNAAAIASAAAEMPEALTLGILFPGGGKMAKEAARPVAVKLLKYFGGEQIQEQVTNLADQLIDYAVKYPDMPLKEWFDKKYIPSTVETAQATTIQAPAMGLAGHGMQRMAISQAEKAARKKAGLPPEPEVKQKQETTDEPDVDAEALSLNKETLYDSVEPEVTTSTIIDEAVPGSGLTHRDIFDMDPAHPDMQKPGVAEYRLKHDDLTGLKNRSEFYRNLNNDVKDGNEVESGQIDFDKFKPINDYFGHEAGDEVLRTFGKAVRALGLQDNIYRVGGEEFGVRGYKTEEERNAAIAKLEDVLSNTKIATKDAQTKTILNWTGLPFSQGHAKIKSVDEYKSKVDEALYADKERRKGLGLRPEGLQLSGGVHLGSEAARLYRERWEAQKRDSGIGEHADAGREVGRERKTSPEGYTESDFPVEQITHDPDLPNYKKGADPTTGVVPGEGLRSDKYERVGRAPIILWERNDGRTVVVTGRNRLDLAKRVGEKTIPAQIFKESDGFTLEQMRRLDAESNIMDNMGTIRDMANYFKVHSDITKDIALSRGLLSREKGKQAFDIARDASEEVYTLWMNDQITDQQAVSITHAAPGNEKAQLIGARYARDGKSAEFVSNMVKVALHNSGGEPGTIDLFGNDDSAMRDMEAQASRAAKIQRSIKDQIAAVSGAAKRPAEAKKLGVDVHDPEGIKKKIAELKAEASRWNNWPLHPDLVEQVMGKSNEDVAPIEKKPDEESGQGGIELHSTPFLNPREIAKAFRENPVGDMLTRLATRGKVEPNVNDNVSEKMNLFNKYINTPHYVGWKYKQFAPVVERAEQITRDRDSLISKMLEVEQPYYDLKPEDRKRVDTALEVGTLKKKVWDDDQLKRGFKLNDAQISAYKAMRQKYDIALEEIKTTFVEMGGDKEYIDKEISKLKGYVPLSRFGDFAVNEYHSNGKKLLRSERYKTYAQAQARSNELAKQNPSGKYDIKKHDKHTGDYIFSGVDPAILELFSKIADIDPNVSGPFVQEVRDFLKGKGFSKHFMHRKGTPGYSKDWSRVHADYTVSLANYLSKMRGGKEMRELVGKIDPKEIEGLLDYANKYTDYVINPGSDEAAKLRNMLFYWYLGANVKSAALNLTQSATTTVPYLSQYTHGSYLTVAKNMSKVMKSASIKDGKWTFDYEAFGEAGKALQEAESSGIVNEQQIYELMAKTRGEMLSKEGAQMGRAMMYIFAAAEHYNRRVAFLSAYEIGQKLEKQGKMPKKFDSVQQFAEEAVKESQFRYGRFNRPTISRGKVGATFFTFKNFSLQYGEMMYKLAKENGEQINKGAFLKGMGIMFLLAGGAGLPFADDVKKGIEFLTKKSIDLAARDATEKIFGSPEMGEVMLRGITRLGPYDMSGAIGLGDMLPEPSALSALGPAGGLVQSGIKAYLSAAKGENLRAIENLMPKALSNAMAAGRMVREGVRSPRTNELISDAEGRWPKPVNVAGKLLGFQPSDVSRAYERENAQGMIGGRVAEMRNNYVYRLAKAAMKEDNDEVSRIVSEIEAYNKGRKPEDMVVITPAAIKSRIKMMSGEEDESGMRRSPKRYRGEYRRIGEQFK